jgi:hypothetical protein
MGRYKMTKEQAVRMARLEAVMSGGVAYINGKKLKGKNGYWYLGFKKVVDPDTEVLPFVEVDEKYVRELMGK